MKRLSQKRTRLLQCKAAWVKEETLRIHKIAPETRIASSLSPIEIFVTLYYGKILRFNPRNINWDKRDRFIVSKGHGAVSLYPVLADLGFFNKQELRNVCKEGSCFGSIPDSLIPGFETINGSLGNGLGMACGIALALKRKKNNASVFVLTGDGELFEGAMWEAIMFAAHHRLDNLILIVDNNKISMLDYCKNIIDLHPLKNKFKTFGWNTKVVDGHDIRALYTALWQCKSAKKPHPNVLIADTKKGKGIAQLENDPLCHIKTLKGEVIDMIMKGISRER